MRCAVCSRERNSSPNALTSATTLSECSARTRKWATLRAVSRRLSPTCWLVASSRCAQRS
eukprot:14870170-Alexandrium_andersonii.AAC.1